jgi:hypothetical protein
MRNISSNHPVISAFLLLVLLGSPWQLSAETPTEAVSEGVADALGQLLNDTGNPVGGGSLRALEQILGNWDNVTNPCRNSLRLLSAFIMDAKEGGGLNFADTLTNTFDIPQFGSWTFAQLAAQGEIISNQLRSGNRAANIARIRQAMREIRLLCNPPPPPQTAIGSDGTPPPAVTTGGSSGTVTPPPASEPEPQEPAPPPPPPEPEWSVDNPCPECELEAEIVEYFLDRITTNKQKQADLQQQLADNRAEQARLQQRIAQLDRRLDQEAGVGASSTDSSGNTTSSYDQGDGTVLVQTTNAQGQVTESHSYQRRSTKDIQREKAEKEAELANLKQEETRMNEHNEALSRVIAKAEADLVTARAELADCIQWKCRHGIPVEEEPIGFLPGGHQTDSTGQSTQTACFSPSDMEIKDMGEVPGNASKVIKGAATGALGGLLGSATGGMFSLGGGDEDDAASGAGAALSDNPFADTAQQTINTGNNEAIGLDAILTTAAQARASATRAGQQTSQFEDDDDIFSTPVKPKQAGLTLGVRIPEQLAEDRKFTFAGAYLVDNDCNRVQPTRRYVYSIWKETTFSWSIEFWHWKNDVLVEHWNKVGTEQWSELLAKGQIPLHIGVEFADLSPADIATKKYTLMSHWTYQDNNHIYGYPLGFRLHAEYDYSQLDEDDTNEEPTITFTDLATDTGSGDGWEIDPNAIKNFHDMKGGMTKIDPPTTELPPLKELPESVIDELEPW